MVVQHTQMARPPSFNGAARWQWQVGSIKAKWRPTRQKRLQSSKTVSHKSAASITYWPRSVRPSNRSSMKVVGRFWSSSTYCSRANLTWLSCQICHFDPSPMKCQCGLFWERVPFSHLHMHWMQNEMFSLPPPILPIGSKRAQKVKEHMICLLSFLFHWIHFVFVTT